MLGGTFMNHKYLKIVIICLLTITMLVGCSTNKSNKETEETSTKSSETIVGESDKSSDVTEELTQKTENSDGVESTIDPSETTIAPTEIPEVTSTESLNTTMRDITTMELVKDMGMGINLGNTFEACGDWIKGKSPKSYETAWGSPVITKEMIGGYKDAGFNTIRIPVAWSNMMGDDYTINEEYMERVKTVVDWALSFDLYVILNIHWDNGWWEGFSTNYDECMYRYTRIWTQITDKFKSYGDHLMLESLNEEGCWNDIWNRYSGQEDGKEEAYTILNNINQKFVDIVRASGENNETRHLLIAGYATDVMLTCDPYFKMPTDPMNRCAVSVHYYTPPTFAILEKDADWGKARTTWGTKEDMDELNTNMNLLKETFVDKGIPVIVGEFGMSTGNKTEDMILLYMTTVGEAICSRGMCPVVWDITDVFYDRNNKKMIYPELEKQLNAIAMMKR